MAEIVTFGPFRLELAEKRVFRDGEEVAAQPLIVDLLAHGARNPGRLLTREQLLTLLWPNVHVTDSSLSQLVYKTRKVLGEYKGWWRTVPRRGYRFEAPLESHPPAAPHPGVQAHNLPASRDRFVGRDAERATLRDAFDAGRRLITLCGFGGVGKTRLALEGLRAQPAPRWPGGRWVCSLIDVRSTNALCVALARTLGVSLTDTPVNQLGDALAGRGRTLLLLDNFEQLIPAAAQTVGRWLDRAPEVVFVVTSRAPLRLAGEMHIAIAPMPTADAMALFGDRAGLRGDDAGAVEEIVEHLDRLPLAIELAAPYTRSLTVAGLHQRLASGSRLSMPQPGRDPRHRTIHDTLQWSWELLRTDQQQALAQCTVFEDGFTFEAAAAVLDLRSDQPVDEILISLIEQSLLTVTEGRWTGTPRLQMLSQTHAFAAGKLVDPTPIEQRHGAFYSRYGDLKRVERDARIKVEEWRNLVTAHQRAVARGDHAVAVSCALAAAWGYGRQGPLIEGIALLEATLAATALKVAQRVQLLISLAGLRSSHEDLSSATDLLRRAGQLLDTQPAPDPHLRMLNTLFTGLLRWRMQDPHIAVPLLHDAIAQARALDAKAQVSQGLCVLGNIADERGDRDQAEALYLQGLRSSSSTHAPIIHADIIGNLGGLYCDRGDPRAEARLQEAIALRHHIGDRLGSTFHLETLGGLYRNQGRLDSAMTVVRDALSENRKLGARQTEPLHLNLLGQLSWMNGSVDPGRALLKDAIDLCRALDAHNLQAKALSQLGLLETAANNFSAAHAHFAAAMTMARPLYTLMIRIARSLLWLRQGALDAAAADLRIHDQQIQDLPAMVGVLNSRRGLLFAYRGQFPEAYACFKDNSVLAAAGKRLTLAGVHLDHIEVAVLGNDPVIARRLHAEVCALISDFEIQPQAPFMQRLHMLSESIHHPHRWSAANAGTP